MIETLIKAFIFILPAYFANAAPVLFKTGKSNTPMDYGIKFFDSRRILGKGKTWVGFFVGIITGTFIGFITWFLGILNLYSDMETHILVAFLLSLGTMVGDSIGSFIKRRMNLKSGTSMPIMDQLSFFIFALLFASPYLPPEFDLLVLTIMAIATLIIHYISNIIAYKLKLKRVPW
ncbi:MAG: CDP-2,3-bis-(O-geranylgeranyl)-sn-glycerol synthase [Candidatus Micrarchaeota archaeon]|nr:CDP-2,3-bis-(O-geranylgeranyl)-sn-glycerol synthase [Candidatus Micrarchaeota archaeon]